MWSDDSGCREEPKTKIVSKLTPTTIHTAYVIHVPLFGLPYKRVGEQLTHEGVLCNVRIDKQ